SINVFITFSLSLLGMSKHFIQDHAKEPKWRSRLMIHGVGFIMCISILGVTIFEKFASGGWITIAITAVLVSIAFAIHKHYQRVSAGMRSLDEILATVPAAANGKTAPALEKNAPTAAIMVKSFSGFGIHEVLSIHRLFPRMFRNFIFVSAAVVDSGTFKGATEVESLEDETRANLERYAAWARSQGMNADYRMAVGTEAVESITDICKVLAEEYPRAI